MAQILLCYKGSSGVGAEESLQLEEETLKVPEDIVTAVEDSKRTGDHTEIHSILNSRQINLRSRIVEGGKRRTILKKLLEDAVNGDRIVEQQLDKSVNQIGENENQLNYGIEIDFGGIFKESSSRQTQVVKELLDLRASSREGEQREAITRLVTHPVIATFIHLKWQKCLWYFYLNSAVFTIFLGLYSFFIAQLFYRPEFCEQIQKQRDSGGPDALIFLDKEDEEECLDQKDFYKDLSLRGFAWDDWDDGFIICEIFFILLLIFLTLSELRQAFVLRLQYFKELENLIEWVVIISATITIGMRKVAVDVQAENSAMVRGIAALGITAAWLELIFLIGRYPFSGGDFSIMFYNIIKRTFRYVIAMALMIFGFAFAFMVVSYGIDRESFKNPWKSAMMTLTMILGEFNFGEMYDTFGRDDTVSRGFAMFILLLLIILGTITMVNLFVVVVISDLDQLRAEVVQQSLVNMAQCTILVEAMVPPCVLARAKVMDSVKLCGHRLCSCEGPRMGDREVKVRARKILRSRGEKEDCTEQVSSTSILINNADVILL